MLDETRVYTQADLDDDNLTPDERAEIEQKLKEQASGTGQGQNEEEIRKAKEQKERDENGGKTLAEIEEAKRVADEEAKKKQAGIGGAAATGDETGDEPDNFYDEVNKRHGLENFEVKYPDGVDPLGPEGAYIREKALMEKATNDFDTYLKQSDPRGYEYLLHRKAGGSDEDFFSRPSFTLPEYETFKNDVDLQKDIFVKDLTTKGLDKETIDAVVEKAIKDNKLFEKADAAYKNREATEKKALVEAETKAKQREENEKKAVASMTTVIEDIVNNSKTSNIVIPDAKKAEFATFVKENLFFDGEQFFIIKPIGKDNAADVIQSEYFGFVKGNLSEVVKRAATSQNADAMRRRIKKDERVTNTRKEQEGNDNFIPLSEL